MSDLEIKKLEVDIANVMAQTAKLNKETMWYPIMVTTALFVAMGALIKYIL